MFTTSTMNLLLALRLCVVMCILLNLYTVKANCGVAKFMCKSDYKCIPMRWTCDKEQDCEDGSDERDCPLAACTQDEFNCTNGKCIPIRWQCDGHADCDDDSDEQHCDEHTCPADHFSCANSTACIPTTWKCDRQEDCQDGSDEQNCEDQECASDEYHCADGRCIMSHWLCDGDKDCPDGSDEKQNCASSCSDKEWRCVGTKRCVPKRWRCDGDDDCPDGSDEHQCNVTVTPHHGSSCSAREFTCDNKECLHQSWKCDGEEDCTDGSDEHNCEHVECRPDQFKCDVNKCLDNKWRCDGRLQCRDRTDEHNCDKKCNVTSQFDCTEDGSECIAIDKHCDGTDDCSNHRDEHPDICHIANPCNTQNGGCSYKCVFNPPNAHCICPTGFELDDDRKSCRDFDECQTSANNKCSQICNNTKGYYKCDCLPGYILVDQRHCMADGERPHLLFANRIDLRDFHLSTQEYRVLVTETKSAIALDFDYQDGYVYWSDVTEEVIRRSELSEDYGFVVTSVESEKLVEHSVRTPDGIAFDWLHKNIYWTDTGLNIIGVMNVQRRFQKVLIANDLEEPRAIVVDPRTQHRWIYWTDWGDNAKLEKAGLDGSNRSVIVQNSAQLVWPNGLTIDYVTNKLFWIDAKLNSINSCDFAGNSISVLLSSLLHLKHPFGISVFEDTIYWSDWETDTIYKTNKFTGDQIQSVVAQTYSPMDLHVYHQLRQPIGEKACGSHTHCAQLCLPSHVSASGYTCHCNDSFILDTDHHSCVPTITTVIAPVTHRPVTTTASTIEVPSVEAPRSGHIATVVIGILVIFVLLVIIAYFVFRSYTRTSIKSLNFSNPVYTKTTEDMVSLEKNEFHNTSSAFQPLTQETV